MDYSYITDPGKVREHNEDSVIIVKNHNNEYLLAVADGMGGHRGGEIASSIAISHIGKCFKELGKLGTKEEAIIWIKNVVSETNVLIYKYTEENPESAGMGTTLVLSVLTEDYLLFGNIGDSSGYVYKNNLIHKVTTDHTLVNLLVKSGEITEEEAKEHPRKNVLMKALGATTSVEMDIVDIETDVEVVSFISNSFNALNKLIIKANNRGGTDNISVAFLKKVGVDSDN